MSFDTKKLDLFPSLPGVYLMKDVEGKVIYVGKANNLKQRVKQYFAIGRDTREMIPFLVAKIETIETIIVHSEKEALLLELNLIKQHKPKYNVLLKDDKTYVALKINNRHPWPMVSLVRYRGKPKADGLYFGPYTSAFAARSTLDLIHKMFPLRQCSDQELVRRVRPCILYDMHRCIAPCVNKCEKKDYDVYVDGVTKFLRGQDKELLKDLKKSLEIQSNELEFEKAAETLKIIQYIEKTMEIQKVDKPLGQDVDAFGIFRQGEDVVLSQLEFREGKLLYSRHFNFSHVVEDDQELFETFLMQNYQHNAELPQEILLPTTLTNTDLVAELISTSQKRKVKILTPLKGEKQAIVDMANTNAKAYFNREKDAEEIREKMLLEMEEKFHLTRYPEKIECFDISNLSGFETVASMVTFTNGVKDSNRYRKYKIKTADASDDYGAMKEVLTRRYKRAKEEEDLPDLLIVDGGKGHLNIAVKVLQELDIATIDLISIAKEDSRHDKGLRAEQVFLKDIKDPILLKKNSSILFLLQQIRDEAHRFAITFNRSLTKKKTIKSSLDDIPGIGPKKKIALLKYFGGIQNLKNSSYEELLKVPSITKKDAESLRTFFH